MPEPAGHYFDGDPAVASRSGTVQLDLPERSFLLATDRGVFSAARVDTGTKQLLLDAPPPPATGTFVDLGCGYGPIACALAARAPMATVWALDVNQRALELCRANTAAHGLHNVTVAHVDDAPTDLVVDLLWSNPPIRIGKPALHALLATWLGRLAPNGTAVLVVQKHLGADSLQAWLQEAGWLATRIGSRGGYRLLEVRRS